ncbi:MAG: ABC transporter permease [Lachnospirales bacterium]
MNSIVVEGLAFSLPLFIMAISGIYSERAGVINLAIEGFQGFGAFFGALVVTLLAVKVNGAMENPMLPYIAILMAFIGGMVFSVLHALLCINFKANQVISGVLINILSVSLTGFLTSQINALVFQKPSNKFVLNIFPKTSILLLSEVPIVGGIFKEFYTFEIIIIIVALILAYVLYNTKYGLRLCASGENPHALDAAGVNVAKIRYSAIMLSGGLAGIGGMCFAYSISANFSGSIYFGAGFLSIAALIFGNWRIIPTFFACILFGFARSFGYFISDFLELPAVYSNLILTLPYVLTMVLLVFFSKNNKPPIALGEIYYKGKR